eukprot:TRINITY_DN923_c0_g1_i1.p3 TRINITY_DN923_c0_g1~~TRINITY_DN923_c0_g1_i1.p3  ORF type:complete len:118 (+),score=49.67 TRINITY_DN923_c0_g1_i1:35-388(+)
MNRRPPRSPQSRSSAASDVYKRQCQLCCDVCGPMCPCDLPFCKAGFCPLPLCLKCCDMCKPMGCELGPLCHITCSCCPSCIPEIGPCVNESMSWCVIDKLGGGGSSEAAPGAADSKE